MDLLALLRGFRSFVNPRNHGGPRRRGLEPRDYRPHLDVALEGMRDLRLLSTGLATRRGAAPAIGRSRYPIAYVAPRKALAPDESLVRLSQSLTCAIEIAEGLLEAPQVSFRRFYAALSFPLAEMTRSPFVAVRSEFGFTAEFDRFEATRILSSLSCIPGENARRAATLVVLSLFRMLRILAMASEAKSPARVHLLLCALRADARALDRHVCAHAGELAAEDFERDVFRSPANQVARRLERLTEIARTLQDLRRVLVAVAANLRMELGRAFTQSVPSPGASTDGKALMRTVREIASELRPSFHRGILLVLDALGSPLTVDDVFGDAVHVRHGLRTRLRRDAWMLTQIVRAFGAKARALATSVSTWLDERDGRFVTEFWVYFDAFGYSVLRASHYARTEPFVRAASALHQKEACDPYRALEAAREADELRKFLLTLCEQSEASDGQFDEPFDRRAAAESLRLYLGR